MKISEWLDWSARSVREYEDERIACVVYLDDDGEVWCWEVYRPDGAAVEMGTSGTKREAKQAADERWEREFGRSA